jgi:hypothetical protein
MRIVHVAAAGENRGRVVLRLGTGGPDRIALEAAFRVARAFEAELESVFIEDQELLDCAAYADQREVSLCGRETRTLSPVAMLRQMSHAARGAERQLSAMARIAAVPYRARIVRAAPVAAVARTCADAGPWNVVALAEPVGEPDRASVLRLIRDVDAATGVVLVGRRACRTHGPIVAVVEDVDRLSPMLRMAERLASETSEPIRLLLLGETEMEAMALEARARLALGERSDVTLHVPVAAYREPAAVTEAVRRAAPGFVIGHAGGALLPADASWRPLLSTLECPVFVIP